MTTENNINEEHNREIGQEICLEKSGEGCSAHSVLASPPAPMGRRMKALLATAGVLCAALAFSVTLSDQGVLEAGSAAAANPATRDLSLPLAPAPGTQVFAQGMGMYHWHQQCPLASASTLRAGMPEKHAAAGRRSMPLAQAQKSKLRPCIYCTDLGS